MADWRYFEPAFWSDEDTEDWSFEQKSFYIYLWSNEHCNQAGAFRVSKRVMVAETNLPLEKIKKLLLFLEQEKKVEIIDGIIWIKNFLKHQPHQSPLVWKRIAKDIKRLSMSSNNLPERFLNHIKTLPIPYPKDIDTLLIGYGKGIDTHIRKGKGKGKGKEDKDGTEQNESAPADPPKIKLDFKKQCWLNIISTDKEKWKKAYPACDIEVELERAAQYIISNPKKKKKNWRRYITGWLGRQQDWGGTKKGQEQTEQDNLPDLTDKLRKERK